MVLNNIKCFCLTASIKIINLNYIKDKLILDYLIVNMIFKIKLGVRCCKPSDLTYTLELEKQLKRNRFKKFID